MDSRWAYALGSGVVVALALGLLRGERVSAETPRTDHQAAINTTGTATVRVRPDSVRIFFSVSGTASNANEAQAESAHHVTEAQAAITSLQIPSLKMKTTNVSLEPLVPPPAPGKAPSRPTGYRATNQFTVLITDNDADRLASQAATVMDRAVGHGANSVEQMVFFKEDESAVRRQAMTAAVEDGLQNARSLAAGAGGHAGRVLSVGSEPESEPFTAQVSNSTIRADREATPVIAGDIEITSRVQVKVALE